MASGVTQELRPLIFIHQSGYLRMPKNAAGFGTLHHTLHTLESSQALFWI